MDTSKHEIKNCERCNSAFECKVGDISHCQCSHVKFTEGEYAFIAGQFTDCLCINCLMALQQEYTQQHFGQTVKHQYGNR